ncbi:MAG: hypothetical protein OSB38_33265 [Paraburkholderia fungorum]|jgi:hypothetical protein|nr:hypothetical protein [Paraburkholderia fungorum]
MKFAQVNKHLESCPGIAAVTRAAWGGKACVVMHPLNGFNYLYLQIDGKSYMYAFSLEDAMADDWEPV